MENAGIKCRYFTNADKSYVSAPCFLDFQTQGGIIGIYFNPQSRLSISSSSAYLTLTIIRKAGDEYEYEPADKYFRDGYNLYKRMSEDKENYLLFLHESDVEPTNNAAERAGRKYKRKSAAAMGFRSMAGHNYYCDGLTIMVTMQSKGENIFEGLTKRFGQILTEAE
ncbi:MAG: transposase [Lachnospiraceae bacterium]|nr:transposase [Lachnospiraceae bacterium]